MRFQEVQIIVIDTDVHIFSSLFLLFDESCCQASATSIDYRTALLSPNGWVKAQVLSACQSEPAKVFLVTQFLLSVLHQCFQLGQSFLDLRHCTRAINELPVLWVMLLVSNDEGKQRDCFPGA